MRILKRCIVGTVMGLLELLAAALIPFVWKGAVFGDVAFGLGLITLILGLLTLFGTKRVHAGMNVLPGHAGVQSGFQANVAFQEAKLARKIPPVPTGPGKVLPIFIAAAVVFIGAGIGSAF